MKESLKYYFTSIAITLILIIFAAAFFQIAAQARSLTGDATQEVLQLQQADEDAWRFTVFGETYEFSFQPLKTANRVRKSYFTLTPAPVRLIEQGVAALQEQVNGYMEQQRREEFEKNIQD
ncbi:hypothetical protein [Candidatus Soleaferrea massiliensis]|uniref:hypothetical protein n=1 Tax=Candidatus Soleaferrea massiliensis TaxID=1470354 RepID=UPI00058EF767|nr:hypothetical protein [Candidatus Soleaferrea massiliensis]